MSRLFGRRRLVQHSSAAFSPSPIREAVATTLPPVVRNETVEYSRENVEKRAYYLFLARTAMSLPGTPETDWQQAEREVWEMSNRSGHRMSQSRETAAAV